MAMKSIAEHRRGRQGASPRARARHPFLRRLEHIFWFAGALAAGWFVLASLGILSFQVTQAHRLEKLESSSASAPVAALQRGDLLGRISIPRIGLSAIIAEGDDDATLRHAVGHIPGTAAPWNSGNVALAGHRDTFFRDLRRVRLDDIIVLQTLRGTFRYRVERISIVGPEQIDLLQPSESDLTLVTCFPFHYVGPAPRRYVVQGSRVATH
jgi:sortase A